MALPALLLAAAVARWTVDEGTQAALVEDHRAPIVEISIEFPVGTWSPWARAHHAEDAFVHQNDDPGRSLMKRADALAATIELDMHNRHASMELRCLKSDLAATLALAKDVLANTHYDAHELKRAGRESAIRWRGNRTDVSFRMGQAMARRLYSKDDPRRLPYEKNESVSSDVSALVTARDLLIRLPGRVIGFAGDLTEDEARHASEGLLPIPNAAVPSDLAPRLEALAAAPSKPETEDIAIPKLTQVYLAFVRDSITWTDPRRLAFLVADHVLGGHFYSRLYVALRHDAGDTYGAGTRDRGDIVPGAYSASTFTKSDNAATIETKLRGVIDVFYQHGITEEERAGAIAYLRGNRALDRQSAGQILSRYMTERRLGLAPGFLDDQIERAAQVSLDDVNALIRDYYDPAKFVMLRVVPE